MKLGLKGATVLATILLLGLAPVAEAGTMAVLAAHGQQDPTGMLILIGIIALPLILVAARRKYHLDLAKQLGTKTVKEEGHVTVRHVYEGLPQPSPGWGVYTAPAALSEPPRKRSRWKRVFFLLVIAVGALAMLIFLWK